VRIASGYTSGLKAMKSRPVEFVKKIFRIQSYDCLRFWGIHRPDHELVEIIERWEPAEPGERSQAFVIGTGQALKLVSRKTKDGFELPL